MVGRKTKFTTQNKTTQGRRNGGTARAKNNKTFKDTEEEIMEGKDGKEINSKEKQDEGEPGRGFSIFFLF